MENTCEITPEELLAENNRRLLAEAEAERYDPETGLGCVGQRLARLNPHTGKTELLPAAMAAEVDRTPPRSALEWQRMRICCDFEYWAVTCARIKDKVSGRLIPFRLNRGQRRVVDVLEGQRQQGRPMRLIVLKARQWGCSTVVEMYMAWLQCCVVTNCHSLLCAQLTQVAASIRDMLCTLLHNYPAELWMGEEGTKPRLVPFQGQQGVREISGRSCHIMLGTSESVNATRGFDCAMAHLTEVAFWKDTPSARPADLMRTVTGSVIRVPGTLIVMESTANGMGNFFHREWCRCASGRGDKATLFVPWHEIALYREEVTDPVALWQSLDDYERRLWSEHGLTLERIQWYHNKRREVDDHAGFMAEYPTTAEEAFASTQRAVFSPEAVERLRPGCMALQPVRGEVMSATGNLTGDAATRLPRFTADSAGRLLVWRRPEKRRRYVAAVDIGGRSLKADWSVIAVLSAPRFPGDRPEVVAQWRGHIDHDLLAYKAAVIARWYNTALLVFESNTLEQECASTEGTGYGAYLLHTLADIYPQLYHRTSPAEDGGHIPGFHTNRATKQLIITGMIAAVRDSTFIERDPQALDEMAAYELKPSGAYGAMEGCHDDILMTRAIALHVISADARILAAETDPSLARYLLRWR